MRNQIVLILALIVSPFLYGQNGYIHLQGKQFVDGNGNNFYPITLDYVLSLNYTSGTGYYLAPAWSYGQNAEVECFTSPACNTRIHTDLYNVKALGFNSVKIAVPIKTSSISPFFFYTEYMGHNGSYSWPTTTLTITSPVVNNLGVQAILNGIDDIINYSSSIGLKVIISGPANDSFNALQTQSLYLEYMKLLADRMKNYTSLLSYQIFAEPGYNNLTSDFTTNKKHDVCVFSTQCYDSIKSHDPNHLIAYGLGSWENFFEWDPAVTKADYVEPHVYFLDFQGYEDHGTPVYVRPHHNLNMAMDRVNAFYYFMQNNCPIPFITGEAAFPVPPDCYTDNTSGGMYTCNPPCGVSCYSVSLDNKIMGDETDEVNYVQAMLTTNRNAGGLGFIWYQLQDGFSDKVDNTGVLRHGNWDGTQIAAAWNNPQNSTVLRPYAVNFKNYLTNGQPPARVPMQQPPNYYDPYHHSNTTYAPNVPPGNIVTGTIKDQYGNPIKDAIVLGFTAKNSGSNEALTFTDNNGQFTIIPFDEDDPTNASKQYFRWIKISAAGASTLERGSYNGTTPITNSSFPNPIILNKISLKLDETVSNQTIANGQNKSYKASRNLTVYTNNTVQSGGIAEFKAYDEVNIKGEFLAAAGSETHIYNAHNFTDCSELDNMHLNFKVAALQNNSLPPAQEVNIFPNPSKGKFSVVQKTNDKSSLSDVYIYNTLGMLVRYETMNSLTKEFDLSSAPKGVYFIKVQSADNMFAQKIVIQ